MAGVGLSLVLYLFRTSRPHIATVGLVPGTEHFRNVLRHDVRVSPRLLSLRVDESLYFANARSLEDRVNDSVAALPELRHVVLQCSAINAIDASALESLEAIESRLRAAGIAAAPVRSEGAGDGPPSGHRLRQAPQRPHLPDALPGHRCADARAAGRDGCGPASHQPALTTVATSPAAARASNAGAACLAFRCMVGSRQPGGDSLKAPPPPQLEPKRMSQSALPTFRIPEGACIPQAQPAAKTRVTLDSPALEIMTDLTQVRAATVDPDVTLPSAEQAMIHQGVRLLFVVKDFPCVEGLVTSTDLLGEKPMRVVNSRNIRHEEVRVVDVMTGLSALDAIDFDALKLGTVRQLVATFKQFGRRHLLVVQAATRESPGRIRGVLSQTQLEQQLGHAIDASEIADTFADIKQALN